MLLALMFTFSSRSGYCQLNARGMEITYEKSKLEILDREVWGYRITGIILQVLNCPRMMSLILHSLPLVYITSTALKSLE